jgi:hypothetical protein
MDDNLEKAKKLKLVLSTFEQLSRLKIKFHKSEIFCFGDARKSENIYSKIYGFQIGTYPFKYLGIPMHYKRINNIDWKTIEQRIEKKLSSWKWKLLSVGGRFVLINSVLTSMVLFMLCFFQVPRGALEKIEYFRSRFFWQNDEHKKKYILAKWDVLCQPKVQGGMGIMNTDIQNHCLLSKWMYKLINKQGIWQHLLLRKYMQDKALGQI